MTATKRLTILCTISVFLFGCNTMPKFPRDDVQFLNKKDNEIRYYYTPQIPGGPFTYIKSEPMDPNKIYDICIKAGYEMQLSDYAKNLQKWGQAHCK